MYFAVTTTNRDGWEQTGRRMVESFMQYWPSSIPLTVYAEDFTPDVPGVEVSELPDWHKQFKLQHATHNGWIANGSRYDYRFDAVKFVHKVAAITDFALRLSDGIVIWIDADIITHSTVTESLLASLFPRFAYLAWLDRAHSHPECGFMMFRCSRAYHQTFMESFRNLYTSGDLFKLREHHDSFALQRLVASKVAAGKMPPPASLSGDAYRCSHPAINGPLGAFLDHCKGPTRKALGRSMVKDLSRPRPEPYWQPA